MLIASYVVDWAILIIFAGVGYAVGNITPNRRPINLQEPNIGLPYLGHDTISLAVLFVVSLIAPAVIIFIISMLVVPGLTATAGIPRAHIWRRRLWEWHVGWLGLALSLVIAWFFTSGMKNLFGKPRPNFLERCQPDYAHAAQYIVGKMADAPNNGQLVYPGICTNSDKSVVDEGFRSFPSGHSSVSAAGLVYLCLILAAKLRSCTFSLSLSTDSNDDASQTAFPSRFSSGIDVQSSSPATETNDEANVAARQKTSGNSGFSIRRQAAAAPLYALFIVLIPLGTAVFISSSRWSDFQHHGFDIIFGFLIGTISSILGFRQYHLPVRRGAGWAWGPRNKDKAFWTGIGNGGFSAPKKVYHQRRTSVASVHDMQDNFHNGGINHQDSTV
ncbi:hypothetical protein LMH87_001407 [Akanthomyces muscarius]|uniref:Phosphatidic acid phosphatase type 2/haloperoxidase domain-containing protein n=1 Tax=Akanthomyces muscarius TaxID=2231603 RepID=A0A9W8Q4S5_AKAMU|nr:hypothetical protein LMH87_001407 [Akanthomyces muscarius]KAJ4146848.1 hypothetical protein LMH87_001407 [Akanthomyces muscarius]